MAAVVPFAERSMRARAADTAVDGLPSRRQGSVRQGSVRQVSGRSDAEFTSARETVPKGIARPGVGEAAPFEGRRVAGPGMRGSGRGVRPANRSELRPLRVAGGAGVPATSCEPRSRSLRVLVLLGLLSAAAVAALVVVGAASTPESPERNAAVQVHEGQTLSKIAASSAPDADRSSVLRRIRRLNHLQSGVLHSGQVLVVPVSGSQAGAGA